MKNKLDSKACALLIMLMALPFSQRTHATEWVPLPGAGIGDQYFYDRSKLTIKDDEIIYWKKVVFKTPQHVNGRDATSGLLRERIQCTDHTSKLMSYLYYSASGETVQYVANDESEPAPIIPDTVGDAFDRALCPLVWQKQEEARIKSEQNAVETELKETAKSKEEKKPAISAPAAPKPPNIRLPQKPATPLPSLPSTPLPAPLPMPQVMDQLY